MMALCLSMIALLVITGAAAGFATWLECWRLCRCLLLAWTIEIDIFVVMMIVIVLEGMLK